MAYHVPLRTQDVGLRTMNPGEQDVCRMVLEALPVAVYLVNREGKVTLWSAGAEKLTGYLRQDVLGRLCEIEILEHEEAGSTSPPTASTNPGRARSERSFSLSSIGALQKWPLSRYPPAIRAASR